MMCTSSILHLCSISVQRYLAIKYPLKTRNKSKSIVAAKIGMVWVAAVAISSPVTVLGAIDESNILNDRNCLLKNDGFIMYGSILAFFIPLIIMVITYALTVRLLFKQSVQCDPNGRAAKEGIPIIRRSKTSVRRGSSLVDGRSSHKRDHYELFIKERMNNNKKENLYQHMPSIISHTVSCETLYGDSSSSPKISTEKRNKSCFLDVPRTLNTEFSSESDIELSEDDDSRSNKSSQSNINLPDCTGKASLKTVMTRTIIIKASSILSLARQNHDKTAVRTEQKASKVLGLVFAIFVILWLPFFIINIIPAVCKSCYVEPTLQSTFVWLGWASSTINPIIYTMFNNTFKHAFGQLLCCRYSFRSRKRKPSTQCRFNVIVREHGSDKNLSL